MNKETAEVMKIVRGLSDLKTPATAFTMGLLCAAHYPNLAGRLLEDVSQMYGFDGVREAVDLIAKAAEQHADHSMA